MKTLKLALLVSVTLLATQAMGQNSVNNGGGLPGGSNGQIQYNNNSTFGGLSQAAHQVPVATSSSATTFKTLPDCQDTNGSHFNYTQSSDSFSCGTSSSGTGGTAGAPMFVATAAATAVTGTSDATLVGSGAGSLTLPVNWFTAAGAVLEVAYSGKYSTAITPGTLQLKIKFGSTVVCQTPVFTPIASVTDGVYGGVIRLVARTVGAGGTIFCADIIPFTGSTITPGEAIFSNPTLGTAVTIDTTATQAVDMTAIWGTGATNSMTGYTFTIWGPGSAVSSVFGLTGAVMSGATPADDKVLVADTGTTATWRALVTGAVKYTTGTNSFAQAACADLSNATGLCSATAPSGTVVGTTDTQTLTNKRVTPRVSTTASSGTPTPNGDTDDVYTVTALATNATFGAPTGTPTEAQRLLIRIKDNGTPRTLGWNAIYRASSDLALPTTTITSKTQYVMFIYNNTDSKWDFVAFLDNF